MRHAEFDSLVDRYLDGALELSLAVQVEEHAAGCRRCGARLAAARVVLETLEAAAPARAPRGFTERVMDGVYREALRGAPAKPETAPRRSYRKLGLSFVITAAVLAASLFIPSAAYPGLLRPRGDMAVTEAEPGGAAVKGILAGAGLAVRGALHPAAGPGARVMGGPSR
jgi:anti-sigma factor RsiW